jgi:hypothetical protein
MWSIIWRSMLHFVWVYFFYLLQGVEFIFDSSGLWKFLSIGEMALPGLLNMRNLHSGTGIADGAGQ